jgi:hypothetical protein
MAKFEAVESMTKFEGRMTKQKLGEWMQVVAGSKGIRFVIRISSFVIDSRLLTAGVRISSFEF